MAYDHFSSDVSEMKSEPGPLMTLGGAASCPGSFHRVVPPLQEHTASPGAGNATILLKPATASLRAAEGGTSADPAEMARRYGPETPAPGGASGWSVPVAG
jgi:hypothetical protein